jgi:putative OPT family oligopeptide transporter
LSVREQKPLIPAESTLPELTVKALVAGVLFAVVLGAANAYLAIKAGQTVSGMFPAAVIAIALFRLPFFRGSLLEQNLTRTAASVGEALVAGAAFTLPAFLLVEVDGERLWTHFRYWESTLILLVGGVLGVLFITLLRRTLTVDAELPWPESRACTEIVKAGQQGDSGARYVFGALGLGMLIQLFKDGAGLRLLRESIEWARELPSSVIHHFDTSRAALGDITHRGILMAATPAVSPALIGVGYVIGFELSAINFAGGVLAWFVLIPFAVFLNPELPNQLGGAGGPAPMSEVVFSVWYNQIRPIAVGAMLVGAGKTMWSLRGSIASAFRGALRSTSAEAETSRLERDLNPRLVLLATAALTVPMFFLYYHFSQSLLGAAVSAIVMLALGFVLSAVGGYLVGLVGGSNQPISGLALSTLILAALLLLTFGVTGLAGMGAVLGVAAVVCCACAVSGSLIQDLKVGQSLGGTPWKMEVAEIVATVVVSLVLVFPMIALHEANLKAGGIGIGDRAIPAPQAGLMAQLTQGIVGGEMPWGLLLFGMAFSLALILFQAPSPMLIAVGMYLPFETTAALFVGGCLKALIDRVAKAKKIEGSDFERMEGTGMLIASGLIAGESLMGVALAGLVATGVLTSVTQTLFGIEGFAWVDGPAGAWASLLAFGALVWALVGVPLRRSTAARP